MIYSNEAIAARERALQAFHNAFGDARPARHDVQAVIRAEDAFVKRFRQWVRIAGIVDERRAMQHLTDVYNDV